MEEQEIEEKLAEFNQTLNTAIYHDFETKRKQEKKELKWETLLDERLNKFEERITRTLNGSMQKATTEKGKDYAFLNKSEETTKVRFKI